MKLENGVLMDMDYDEKHLVFPKEMLSMDEEMEWGNFLRLDDVESISVEDGNPAYHSEGNCLIDTAQRLLILGCKNSVIPDGIELIDCFAFAHCELKQVTLPEGVLAIGGSAFSCTDIQSVTIPKTLDTLCPSVFSGCTKLHTLEVHPDNPVYRSENNCIIEKATNTLMACCDEPVIPEGVEIIETKALSLGNTRHITLPASVREIRKSVFNLPPLVEFGCREEVDETGKHHAVQAVIRAPKGSYAIEFAKSNGLPYEELD